MVLNVETVERASTGHYTVVAERAVWKETDKAYVDSKLFFR